MLLAQAGKREAVPARGCHVAQAGMVAQAGQAGLPVAQAGMPGQNRMTRNTVSLMMAQREPKPVRESLGIVVSLKIFSRANDSLLSSITVGRETFTGNC
jgi:hypothetical protein